MRRVRKNVANLSLLAPNETPRTVAFGAGRYGLALAGRSSCVVVALGALACGQGGKPSIPAAKAPTRTVAPPHATEAPTVEGRQRQVDAMLKRVGELRGLREKNSVPAIVLARPPLIRKVREHVEREIPASELEAESLSLKLLGLIPTDYAYERGVYALLEAQLAGFYEPTGKAMYLADDLDEQNASATLAHELVHALQDQYWDLEALTRFEPGRSDSAEALSALAEGDATSTMLTFMLRASGVEKQAFDIQDEVLAEQIRAGTGSSDGDTPEFLRESLLAPYVYGTTFVHSLLRTGGQAAVDAAWASPPTTTEQVLHPAKWGAREPKVEVNAVDPSALGADWSIVNEDTMGELELRQVLGQWLGAERAAQAAESWGGDRVGLYAHGQERALVWSIVYDADVKPRTKAETVVESLRARFGKNGRGSRDSHFLCVARADVGPLVWYAAGHTLLIVAGPYTPGSGATPPGKDCASQGVLSREGLRRAAKGRTSP